MNDLTLKKIQKQKGTYEVFLIKNSLIHKLVLQIINFLSFGSS